MIVHRIKLRFGFRDAGTAGLRDDAFQVNDQVEVFDGQQQVWNAAVIKAFRDKPYVQYQISFVGWGDKADWIRAEDLKMRHADIAAEDVDSQDISNRMDLSALQDVLAKIPSVDEMKAWALDGEPRLVQELDRLDNLIYPLLRWLVATNRYCIPPYVHYPSPWL